MQAHFYLNKCSTYLHYLRSRHISECNLTKVLTSFDIIELEKKFFFYYDLIVHSAETS